MKRRIITLISALLCFSVLVSCSGKQTDVEIATNTSSEPDIIASEDSEIPSYNVMPVDDEKSEPMAALDRYFAAINKLDPEEHYTCTHPDMSGYNAPSLVSDYYVRIFPKGYLGQILTSLSKFEVYDESLEAFLRSYGYQGELSQMQQEYQDDIAKDDLSKTMKDFSVSYNLNILEEAENCKFYTFSYPDEVTQEKILSDPYEYEELEKRIGVRPDRLYFANISVEWKYGDKLYGNDKTWWDELEYLNNSKSYDDVIEEESNKTYDLIIYETGSMWYVYQTNPIGYYDFAIEYK